MSLLVFSISNVRSEAFLGALHSGRTMKVHQVGIIPYIETEDRPRIDPHPILGLNVSITQYY